MVVSGVSVREGLLLASFLFLSVYGQDSGPYFMVTFPAVIESGSDAKLCVSLLKPNETLQMTIYLVHNHQNRTLLEERVEKEFHRCSHFKAPRVEGQSVQKIKVEVKGENFMMTEERKVKFKSYNPLIFIQTDKPIYNPGQTVNFRIVAMDANFVPLQQKYSLVALEDSKGNRIGQWTNVSSTGLILQLSHKLNPEAVEGLYKLMAVTGDEEIMQTFKVKKYVLPRFEVTLKAPQQQSVGEQKLKIEVCGKYSYGQPVTGKALVEVCQKFNSHYPGTTLISPCLVDAVEMKENGCATAIFNFSHFMNFDMGQNVNNFLDTTATVTEEGTDISMKTSATTEISYEIGRAEFVDVPKTFERHIVIEGKIKVTSFSGAPVPNKEVYLLEGDRWSAKLLRNLTTDDNGLVNFTVNAPKDPKTQISLLASVYPNYQHHRTTPFFRISDTSISLLQPATPYSPVYSELLIENLEEPLRCGAAISINIKYYIVGETAENYSTDIIYMVSLQFSAIEAVPGEENTLQVSALPGSLCALSAVDQSVFIMEPEERLNANKIFNLLPVKAVSTYTSDIEDIPKCTFDLPRDHTYTTVENAGIKMVTNLALRDPRCFIYEHYYVSMGSLNPSKRFVNFSQKLGYGSLLKLGILDQHRFLSLFQTLSPLGRRRLSVCPLKV